MLLVSCDDSWEFQVIDHLLIGEDIVEWPGDDYFIRESEERCSLTTFSIIYPSEDSWFLGDRSLYCLRGS